MLWDHDLDTGCDRPEDYSLHDPAFDRPFRGGQTDQHGGIYNDLVSGDLRTCWQIASSRETMQNHSHRQQPDNVVSERVIRVDRSDSNIDGNAAQRARVGPFTNKRDDPLNVKRDWSDSIPRKINPVNRVQVLHTLSKSGDNHPCDLFGVRCVNAVVGDII
jgi:hypothetical protein